MTLTNKLGREISVAAAEASGFEVTTEEAARWARSGLAQLLESVEAKVDRRAAPPAPRLSLLSELTGESSADLREDPQALKQGLKKLGNDLLSVVKAGLSSDDDEVADAQATLDRLREILDRHSPEASSQAVAGEEDLDSAGDAALEGAARVDPQREQALSTLAGFARSFARFSEQASKRFAEAADELKVARETAQTGNAEEREERASEPEPKGSQEQ